LPAGVVCGRMPACPSGSKLADPCRDEQLSLLYKTDAAGSPVVPFERIRR
jgi:hypothetical protein